MHVFVEVVPHWPTLFRLGWGRVAVCRRVLIGSHRKPDGDVKAATSPSVGFPYTKIRHVWAGQNGVL